MSIMNFSSDEKWENVLSAVRSFQGSIDNARDDKNTAEADKLEMELLSLLKNAYSINFKSNVRPKWAIDKIKERFPILTQFSYGRMDI